MTIEVEFNTLWLNQISED